MTRHLLLTGLFLVVITGMIQACVSAPAQEMSDARQALMAAEAADADLTASTLYQLAIEQIEVAEQALYENRFSLAREKAKLARDNAIQARKIALTRQN